MTVYGERRKKLLSLARGKQVAATTAENLFYLTDFYGGGAALVLPDKTVVFTSPLEAERAEDTGQEVEVVVAKTWKEVPDALMKRSGKGLLVIDEDPGFKRARVKEDPAMFLAARRVKDEVEVDRIRKASEKLDKIFEALPGELRVGRTEWEVAGEVMKLATSMGMTPSGSSSALSPTIVASGENGALPHSELTARKLRRGDFVVADIFFRFEGYNSDMTRTFAIGRATKEMSSHYQAVFEAQDAAMRTVRVGVAAQEVHRSAVRELKARRLDGYLNHSVGHGVGIDIHELPSIAEGSKTRLISNDVITDEPGIYLPGKYGIRIEDTLVVDKKAVPLTKYTKELVICD